MHSTHLEQGGLFLSRKRRRILLLHQGNNLSLCTGRIWVFSRFVLQTEKVLLLWICIWSFVLRSYRLQTCIGCKHYLLPALECHWLLRLLHLKSWLSHSGGLTGDLQVLFLTALLPSRLVLEQGLNSRIDLWSNRKKRRTRDQNISYSKNKKEMGRRKE